MQLKKASKSPQEIFTASEPFQKFPLLEKTKLFKLKTSLCEKKILLMSGSLPQKIKNYSKQVSKPRSCSSSLSSWVLAINLDRSNFKTIKFPFGAKVFKTQSVKSKKKSPSVKDKTLIS